MYYVLLVNEIVWAAFICSSCMVTTHLRSNTIIHEYYRTAAFCKVLSAMYDLSTAHPLFALKQTPMPAFQFVKLHHYTVIDFYVHLGSGCSMAWQNKWQYDDTAVANLQLYSLLLIIYLCTRLRYFSRFENRKTQNCTTNLGVC